MFSRTSPLFLQVSFMAIKLHETSGKKKNIYIYIYIYLFNLFQFFSYCLFLTFNHVSLTLYFLIRFVRNLCVFIGLFKESALKKKNKNPF